METKKYKLKTTTFLNWYFADGDDYKYIGRRVEYLLKNSVIAKISIIDLFEEQEELPTWLLESYNGEDDYLNVEFIELIKG